ncbi:protein SCAF11 isoform X2 [Perognathus longimembris pacificus]|uniref:protein SCAF11 isoform X2 n=1 Tax=Perognathus longimembris pacificus TaxID=214514 RepID=UPI0020192D8A|nr:protein SCAF11 isoform X2 [Perognathus longimembris pacificus]
MKKKIVYTINVGDHEYEDMEGEENRNDTVASGLLYNETDRCPICLNCLLEKEVGFPESCNHVFCMTCILKWAETLASCPIDRKPFQAVFKFSPLEGCVKVQIKRQLRETKEKKTESSFKKQLSCHESSETSTRKKAIKEDLLTSRFFYLKMIHRKSSNSKTEGQKNAVIKTDKPRRSNQCTSYCFRNFFSNMFPSSSHTGESFTYRAYCTEFIEVSEISALIMQKRQELELSWFPGTLPGSGRIGFVPWNVETEVLPLISSVLPRSIFPTNTMSLENFGTSCKGNTLAHTQEGDEKKQASGSSNTRGSRRKPTTTTPTRRSTRNTRAETVSQSQKSPVSSNSGCDAPGNNIPPESVSSPVESEKQRRQAPKRKSIRRGRKPPSLKKKLRRSVPSSEKTSSSDSVEEEITESDTPPVLEKEQQSDVESSNVCSLQTDVENQLSDCLERCSEQIGENEDHIENHDSEGKLESSDPKSCNQDTSVLVSEEGGIEKLENTGIEAEVSCLENEISEDIFEKENEPLENHDQVSGSSESEVKAVTCVDHPPDYLKPEVCQAVSSPLDGTPDNAESVINEEKLVDNVTGEVTDHNKDSAVKTEEIVERPKLQSLEGEIIQRVDKKSIESSEIQFIGNVETENAVITATCNNSENENMNSSQDSESRNDTPSDKSLKDKTESPVEHPMELLQTPIEQIEMHFSEDNNEMIPMECDSLCSDQNESEIESSANTDSKQLSEDSVTHGSETSKTLSDPTNIKGETSQPSESPVDPIDKAKKPRTRKSRFHSPSTTWSPNKDTTQEKKRSQSPSPKRETGKESKKSQSPSPKKESARGRRKSRSQSPRKDMTREKRRSQSRSPKRDSTRESKRSASPSPRRDTSRENRRSQSRVKDSSKEKSRSRSRERENDRDGQRRDRDRERRTRRWSRSRSRSRSPSRSRTKSKSSSFSRNERDSYSPRWKERWTNDGWRCPRGSDRYRKNDLEKQNENTRKEKNDVSLDTDDPNSSDKCRNDCPSWVTEKINSGPDPRTRNPEKLKDSHWEENRNENSGNSWNKNFGSSWVSNRGRGNRGRGTYRGGFAYTDQNENRWQNRKPLSGNSNSSGNDSFKYMEQQPYKRKNEQEFSFDTPADRSGWTSASSWAVRKNLPVDVQNYYSRRGRNSSGSQSGWMRQEEETTEQDSNLKDQTNQQVDSSQLPITMMQPQMNVIPQQMNAQHQPMSIFPYPVGAHAPLMNVQRSPFNMHPQLPLHLHTGVPLMQMAAPTSVTQGPPPPPPPPPPSQQVSYVASHPDGNQSQGVPSASHVSNNMSTPVLPAPTAAPGSMGTVQGPSSGNTPSSSHSKASNAAVKLAESKKLQIQEKAAQEVKLAIKPFYQNKDITKEEYKEIVRKAVDKVCHSKSGEVNSAKVANLVKAYVDKYKYSRKGSQKKTLDEPVSTEKHIG